MIQLSPLYIDKQTQMLHNTQEGKCCVLRSQSLESTGSLGVYAIGSLPTVPTIAPESRSKSQTVLSNTKLPILDSYVPTVHFLLHYFSTFCACGFRFTGTCLTISGRGRSRYLLGTIFILLTQGLNNVK